MRYLCTILLAFKNITNVSKDKAHRYPKPNRKETPNRMAVLSGPKLSIPCPEGRQIPGALVQHVALDPGIAYTVADALLFLGTNLVGAVAMVGAVAVATGAKALSVLQPSFLDKRPKLKELINDDRLPLRAGGLAMLVVTGATFAMGAWLPAAASAFFAIANFGLAESVSKSHIEKERHDVEEHKLENLGFAQKAAMLLKRPDIYLNIGFGLAGLMAGGASMVILPLVAGAFWMSAKNTFAGKPEYAGHPKLLTGAAAVLFAGVGVMTGHGLIAAAHLLNGLALGEMERRMTPGGLPQIMKDIGGSIAGLFGRKPKEAAVPAPAPTPVSAFPKAGGKPALQDTFSIKSVPLPQPKKQPEPEPVPEPVLDFSGAREKIADFAPA